MTEQCMHDGKAGPCERRAVALEHFCRRHLPKKKAAPARPESGYGYWHRGLAPSVSWRSSCCGVVPTAIYVGVSGTRYVCQCGQAVATT
jgi:hypothetical protein